MTAEPRFTRERIELDISYRGRDLGSSAVTTLKILAFGLAALALPCGGRGHHPHFLLHDSPRESDLEISLYHQFFHFVHDLEKRTPSSFQYIVTTTEAPPDEIIDSHVRLTLDGSAGEGRLYCQNLR